MIKVFKVNDCDWVAASTPEEALECLKTITDVEGDEVAEELSDDDMNEFEFHSEEKDEHGDSIKIPFRQQLNKMVAAGEKFPTFFASSEW